MAERAAASPQLSRPAPAGMGLCEADPLDMKVPKPKESSGACAPFRPREMKSSSRERGRHGRPREDRFTNKRRFGDSLGITNSRFSRSPNYDPDCELSHIDSVEFSLSSSDKENVKPGRKRLLDDALFEFFRKEAVKTLKDNFSSFCHRNDDWTKNRKLSGQVIGRDDFSSYSIKYFWEVLNSLSNRRKEVIRNFGFGCLLSFEKCEIPSAFVRWLASCVDTVSSQLIIDDSKVLPISKDLVHHVIGLPNSGSVPMPDSECGAKFVKSMFGLTELPHITFFGNKLKSKEVLTDKEVFVCFMVVAFKCFLLPTVDDYPNTDFLSILEEPTSAIGVDLSLLVYEHLISGLSKFKSICKLNGRKPKVFEFCYYALSVYYLDSLDFGARMVDQSVPRISVWKGNLIKFFSDLDHKKKNLFGKRQLKKNLAHCYREFGDVRECKSENDVFEHHKPIFSSEFKHSLHERFGNSLESKIINGIVESVESAQLAKLKSVQKCELLVNNVLNVLMVSKSYDVKDQSVLGRDNYSFGHPATESDVASKLALITPNVFSKVPLSSEVGNTSFRTPTSPDFVSCKAAEVGTFNTAPAIQPMQKFRSRLTLPLPVPVEQVLPSMNTGPSSVPKSFLCISSPISRINFSPLSKDKVLNAPCVSKFAQSPEVQITGTTSFSFRQAQLAKDVDDIYNNMANNAVMKGREPMASKLVNEKSDEDFIDLSQYDIEDRAVKDNLVIIQPKNSLALPLVQNGRFLVSDLDIKHFCAIVDLAYTQGIQKSYAIKYPKVHCSFISLGQSLMVEGHVDNFLIPVFCRKLFEYNHPSRSGRHHFFSLVGESILDYQNDVQYSFISKAFLGAASASKGKRLELTDRLFFPICRMRHWFTFSVDFKYRAFIFLDSLYNKDDEFHTSIKKHLINNFIKLWKQIFKTKENIFKEYGVMYANIPKQDNADDCGIFTMKLMEIFKPELDMHRFFSKANIVNIRIQFANKLFFCRRNSADKSLVLDHVS